MKSKGLLLCAALLACVPARARAAVESAPVAEHQVCAPGATIDGVDVSDHQVNPRWDEVRSSGRRFAFVKATEGTNFTSSSFSGKWADVKAVGMIRGAYHFFVPSDDPVQQADYFLSVLGRPEDGDLPPMLDWEVTDGVSPDAIAQRAKLWLDRVQESTGRVPIIYTYPSYWQKLGSPAGFDQYPLFIANYKTGGCPDVPSTWKSWVFWQHAISTTPGIIGPSDADYFNGDLSALETFAAGTPPPAEHHFPIHIPRPKPFPQ